MVVLAYTGRGFRTPGRPGVSQDKVELVEILRQMILIREFDVLAVELRTGKRSCGALHPCVGEEAVAVGVCAAPRPTDRITSTHRDDGHCIAKGADIKRMMAELFGRADGYCKGKGGSMHIADFAIGMLGANGIVAGGMPIACGAALAAQLEDQGAVAACFFGDGATGEGEFHETLNIASLWKLPLLFVCENNRYGAGNAVESVRSEADISLHAPAYGMPGVSVDGNDVLAVREAARQAVERARRGGGPTLLHCKTFRWLFHAMRDAPQPDLRSADLLAQWRARDRDPSARFQAVLVGRRRVRFTPISEAAFTGIGLGAAGSGFRPVVNWGMVTFSFVAMDQIVNQASKIRYMFGGQADFPVTFRCTTGGGIQLAAQHSQSPYSMFMHLAGLKIILPSTPADAKGLLKSAIRDNNPVVFFECSRLAGVTGPVPDGDHTVPIGVADVKRAGRDVTVVGLAYYVREALAVADSLAKEGISLEVIDPRTLVPMDAEAIRASVRRTGRLVVVDEAPATCSAASEIVALVTEDAETFRALKAPVQRVCAAPVPVPFSPPLEQAALPDRARIEAAIRRVL